MGKVISLTDVPAEFRSALAAAGFEQAPRRIEPGRLYRYPGIGKRSNNNAGWCRLFDDCKGGVYGDWSTDFTGTWQAERQGKLNAIEKARFQRAINAARQAREVEQRERWRAAAIQSQSLWEASRPEAGDHRYLVTKQVLPHGIRRSSHQLIIPVRDIADTWQSLQTIDGSGSKRFLPGGKITGGMYQIGTFGEKEIILICEGFATGATLHEQTGHPVAVAFNAGNLKPVAQAIRFRYSKADLVICGDNDRHTPGNPGATKAKEAALAVGARLAIPTFEDGEQGTDWNDWHLTRREALR